MRVFLAAYLAAVVILGALAVGGGLALYSRLGPDGAAEEAASEHGYNLVGWEIKHFPEKWLHKLQHLFGGPSEQDRNDAICAYFQAAAKLNSTQEPDPDAEKRLAELENDVEDTIEGRVTAVLKDQKLTLEPPLFSDLGLVFPPVDFEIDGTPRVLAVSPRERIELRNSYLLEPDIPQPEIDQIEHNGECRWARSLGARHPDRRVLELPQRGVRGHALRFPDGDRIPRVAALLPDLFPP